MKWSRAGSALMVAAMVAAGSFAQTNEDLQRQLNELKSSMQSQVQRLEAENSALKAQQAPQDAGLETEINRLNERMAAGTNLRSCASQIRLGGEFRYRAAYVDATFDPIFFPVPTPTEGEGKFLEEAADGYYGDMRTRVNFQYDFSSDVTAFAELQAHSAFGEDLTGPFDDSDGNDPVGDVQMYQSWLEIRNIFGGGCGGSGVSARIGRQEIVLGNQFQFGNADWYNGIVHDGIRVDWKSNCWGLTLIASKLTSADGDVNQLWSYGSSHDDDELYAAYFTLKSFRALQVDAYWIYVNGHGGVGHDALNSGTQILADGGFLYPGLSAYYNTFGVRLGGTFNIGCGLDYSLEAAIQDGSSSGFDLGGVTAEAELGWTFTRRNSFRIFARGLWAEGPDSDGFGYQTLYPNRHSNKGFRARYGLADLIPMENVETVQLGLHFDPSCNWTLGVTGLYAQAEQDFGLDESAYGTELDIWAEYRHSANLTLGAGVAFVFPDDFGTAATGLSDDTQIVGYLQARLVF